MLVYKKFNPYWQVFAVFLFYLEFTLCKDEGLLQDMELQEIEESKSEKYT